MSGVMAVPAPVGGINARDSYASMPATDAVYLRDYIPGTTDLVSAPPCELFSSNASSTVRSLIPYEAGTASKLLMVHTSGVTWSISDITTGTAAAVVTGLGGGIYVHTTFQSKIIMCNGVNTPRVYDGTVAPALVATGSGLVTTDLRGVITFKGRAYYWENASQKFWYAAAGAYQGALTSFPIDTLTSSGGKITLLTTFTRDGGEGADDLFCIAMNTGEVLIYQGDDPASSVAWELIGKFQVPEPIGVRSVFRWGARTLLVTTEGLIDLPQILASSIYPLVSDKVRDSLKFLSGQTYNKGSAQADMVAPYLFAETQSLGVITLQQDASVGKYANDGLFHHMTLVSGAWWDYAALGTFDALSGSPGAISCACVWRGRTYYASDFTGNVVTPMVPITGTGGEEIAQKWMPLSNNGYAFAFFPEPATSNGNALALSNFRTPAVNEQLALSAYVQPFRGLTGNLALVQNIIGTIGEYWTGFPRKRWIACNVRLKAGGSR